MPAMTLPVLFFSGPIMRLATNHHGVLSCVARASSFLPAVFRAPRVAFSFPCVPLVLAEP